METALNQKKILSLILVCFDDERPIRGMIAELDWCFDGHFTKLIQSQVLTGKKDEFLYAPLKWNKDTFHFLILGMGSKNESSSKKAFPKAAFERALKKAEELKFQSIGISVRDWHLKDSDLETLQGRNLCILQ